MSDESHADRLAWELGAIDDARPTPAELADDMPVEEEEDTPDVKADRER